MKAQAGITREGSMINYGTNKMFVHTCTRCGDQKKTFWRGFFSGEGALERWVARHGDNCRR